MPVFVLTPQQCFFALAVLAVVAVCIAIAAFAMHKFHEALLLASQNVVIAGCMCILSGFTAADRYGQFAAGYCAYAVLFGLTCACIIGDIRHEEHLRRENAKAQVVLAIPRSEPRPDHTLFPQVLPHLPKLHLRIPVTSLLRRRRPRSGAAVEAAASACTSPANRRSQAAQQLAQADA